MATAAPSDDNDAFFSPPSDKRYTLSSGIILRVVIVLLFVVILMICFHLYVRLYLFSPSRRPSRPRRRPRPHFVFTAESRSASPPRGLPQLVIKSLPLFVHSAKLDSDPIYCSVCLSEFEENETGRVIPTCNHSFHVGCIDMWFYSHVTCPLCRSEVKSEPESSTNPVQIVVEELDRGNPVEVDDVSEHEPRGQRRI